MTQTWLRSNRRPFLVGMSVSALGLLVGLLLGTGVWPWSAAIWLRWTGWLLAAAASIVVVALSIEMRRPRLAVDSGDLLVYLRRGGPIRFPIGAVEVFFLGSGPSGLHGRNAAVSKMSNVVIRLDPNRPEWQQQDVDSSLGDWKEGYITVRGAWCEPLSTNTIRQLNARLRRSRESP